jgi:hypothetical protein
LDRSREAAALGSRAHSHINDRKIATAAPEGGKSDRRAKPDQREVRRPSDSFTKGETPAPPAPAQVEQPLKRRIDFPEPQTAPPALPLAQHKRGKQPPPKPERKSEPIITAAALKEGIFDCSEEEEEDDQEQQLPNPQAKVSSFRYDDIGDEAKFATISAMHDDPQPRGDSADDLFDFGDEPSLAPAKDRTTPQTPPQHHPIEAKPPIDEEEDNFEALADILKHVSHDEQKGGEEEDYDLDALLANLPEGIASEEEDDDFDIFAVGGDDPRKQKVSEEDDLPKQKAPVSTSDGVKKAPEEEKEDSNNTLRRQEVREEIETHQMTQRYEDLNLAMEELPPASDDETGLSEASELLTTTADVRQKDDEGEMTESAIVATKSEILADELATYSRPVGIEEEVADGPNRNEEGEEVEIRKEGDVELEELLAGIYALADGSDCPADGPPADPLGLILSRQQWDKSRLDFEIETVFDIADRICAT